MATKRYNERNFSATYTNKYGTKESVEFYCYTTGTRSGFCHTAHCCTFDLTDTKISYYNRTWERFDYESVLRRAIDKLPDYMRQTVRDQIIDGKAAEEEQKAEAMFQSFQGLYNGLNDENKARMANYPTLQSEDDARTCMAFMGLLTLMQQ